MTFLFVLIALFACFLAIILFKKKEGKEDALNTQDAPTLTYKIDLCKELERIYNEHGVNDQIYGKYETIKEIERSEFISKLANDISHIALTLESLRNDESPYPTRVADLIDDITKAHNRVLKSKKKDITEAVSLAKKELDDSRIRSLEMYSTDLKAIDLTSIKISLFDKYFLNYRDNWESQISQLKRSSAVVNRRKYLVEKCSEWKVFLKNQHIQKYDRILDEYSSFNLSEIARL